ncbi:MAG: ATP-binding protein [Elusimicrobia bacterium]|nr:ATP-binding protein [Elusimicrobiota bacterium]
MGDAQFLKQEMVKFQTEHPVDDGWKTYACYSELAGKLYLQYLLDFLRDRHPNILKRRLALNEVRSEDMLGQNGDCHITDTGSDWDRQKELDANGWSGDIEIEWQGQPIHYRDVIYFEGLHGRSTVTMISTKSNALLREFHRGLDEYGKQRDKTGEPHIMVVNGENIRISRVSWDEVLLADGHADDIRENVEGFFSSRERYKELGIPYRRGFLFTGAPGCGKTLTIKALASSIKATFITVHVRAEVRERDIEAAFYLANKHSPAVVILEDLDRLVKSEKVSISHFLNLLDGLKVLDGVLVIATSNHPENLDPALLHRPSRFDRVWRFALPNAGQRLALLKKKGTRYFSAEVLERVAEKATGFSMAYVQEIIVNALLECAHSGKKPNDGHLIESFETLKKQRRGAGKPDEDLAERESLGFASVRRNLPPHISELETFDDEDPNNRRSA